MKKYVESGTVTINDESNMMKMLIGETLFTNTQTEIVHIMEIEDLSSTLMRSYQQIKTLIGESGTEKSHPLEIEY